MPGVDGVSEAADPQVDTIDATQNTSSDTTSAASSTTVRPTTTTIAATTTAVAEPDDEEPFTATAEDGPDGVADPICVVEIAAGDSLTSIADRYDDETLTAESIAQENGLANVDQINEGDLLDICVGNGLDDIAGTERAAPGDIGEDSAEVQSVKAQQDKLNQLFNGLGVRELTVDGVSGPVTRQRLCAARLALGLTTATTEMVPGSAEEQTLLATDVLPIPFTTSLLSERWILIDRTCQIMFVGAGIEGITFVFPTSTGEEGYGTRDQDRSAAFRYDPASDNGGWHDSTDFPVSIDNPLNGNMYKPIYFDGGQAIHGANNVPRDPQSKGCARLRVGDQDQLIAWMGLQDRSSPTWSPDDIRVTVNVQGTWIGN